MFTKGAKSLKDLAIMLMSLGIILLAAEGFTNGIEWLGKKLSLGPGAVGSVLAAVGTALPETMVPVIAFLGNGSGEESMDIGIGAILGAPFMLATLAFFVSGLSVLIFRRSNRPLLLNPQIIERDLRFFIVVYSTAILTSFLPVKELKSVVVAILIATYCFYVFKTLKSNHGFEEHEHLSSLYLARGAEHPSLAVVVLQLLLSLFCIVVGAHGFVDSVQSLAFSTGIPVFVLSLIVTPIATELPEKFNSILWLKREKDTLALGNITGAMVFQSSIIPALGIALTSWRLTPLALLSGILALGSSALPYLMLRRRQVILPSSLMLGGGFYLMFILTLLRFPGLH